MAIHDTVDRVTDRIRRRSRDSREEYLRRIEGAARRSPARRGLPCTNFAHGFAACGPVDKSRLKDGAAPNVGIVTAYNDMLSAHQPLEPLPRIIKEALREAGATAQVAGGVPAMCDGVTQGTDGMQLSLFSRDVIAQSTAVALSHDMFDAALCLGVCDKIVPGLLIGSLAFGHLPVLFGTGGPMPSGISNAEKSRVRQLRAEGKVGDDALLESESRAYHSPGTCTFYGTSNTNQLLMEVVGLHLPGASFVPPHTPLREALTAATARRVAELTALGDDYLPLGRLFDERAMVNSIVALLATGGSTNHTLHLVAVGRAAGLRLDWEDFDELSGAVPLLARIYPNGSMDVNDFHHAGGTAFLIGELLDAGLLHPDAATASPGGLEDYRKRPELDEEGTLRWVDGPRESSNASVLVSRQTPFAPDGGLRVVSGNLGRAVAKVSAVKSAHRVVEAPARVFEHPDDVLAAFQAGELSTDVVVVVRFQGPRANGMPELHALMPALGVLQDRGHAVALVTDGRLSGASGKVPSALHVTPEAVAGGALARLRDGDVVRVDLEERVVEARVGSTEWDAREPAAPDLAAEHHGMGRELFAAYRATARPADEGAWTFDP